MKEKKTETKEQKEIRQATCSHASRASRMDGHSAFRQISISPQGVSLMKCTKCGLEKTVVVNAHYLTDMERYKGKPRYEGTGRYREKGVKSLAAKAVGVIGVVKNLLAGIHKPEGKPA